MFVHDKLRFKLVEDSSLTELPCNQHLKGCQPDKGCCGVRDRQQEDNRGLFRAISPHAPGCTVVLDTHAKR